MLPKINMQLTRYIYRPILYTYRIKEAT